MAWWRLADNDFFYNCIWDWWNCPPGKRKEIHLSMINFCQFVCCLISSPVVTHDLCPSRICCRSHACESRACVCNTLDKSNELDIYCDTRSDLYLFNAICQSEDSSMSFNLFGIEFRNYYIFHLCLPCPFQLVLFSWDKRCNNQSFHFLGKCQSRSVVLYHLHSEFERNRIRLSALKTDQQKSKVRICAFDYKENWRNSAC